MSAESNITSILVPEEKKAEIVQSKSLAETEVAALAELPCDTQDEVDVVNQLVSYFRARHKATEDQRKTITGPLNTAKRAVDALYKPTLDLLERAETILRAKLAGRLQKQLASDNARTQAALAGAPAVEAPAPVVMAAMRPVYFWKWFVTDLSKVPREYMCVDLEAVQRHTSAYKQSDAIPGIPGIKFERSVDVAAKPGA